MRRVTLPMAAVLALGFGACDYGADRGQGDVAASPSEPMREAPGQEPAAPPEPRLAEEERLDDASDLVQEASAVLDRMKADPALAGPLERAQGVLIVPEFGEGALVVGGRAGEGLLLARRDGGWKGPVFYDIGAISVGAQAGAAGGAIAMLLMNERALDGFERESHFSLDADAGFTLAESSAHAKGTAGEADVILWSDLDGGFAGAALSVTNIAFDEADNRSYYDEGATHERIMSGELTTREAETLRQKLQG